VVADHLVELLAPAVEPVGEALVQLGAELLRDALVGGVADQHVAEAEGVLDRLMRADELLADERRQLSSRGPAVVRSELRESLPLELEADDGGTLDHLSLLIGERVEASSEKRLNRRRHILGVTTFREHREQLLDEERVPFGRVADPGADVIVEPRVEEELID